MDRNLESHLWRSFGKILVRNKELFISGAATVVTLLAASTLSTETARKETSGKETPGKEKKPELQPEILVVEADGLLAADVGARCTEATGKKKKPELQPEILEVEVKLALKNLGPYSNTVEADGKKVLEYLSSLCEEISKWIKRAECAILCLNLVRYFHEQLFQAVDEGGHSDGELHIVLVGDGSISNQVRPANWFVPLSTIRDTILYPPYNCAIDAKVAYGISTGSLRPEHRAFSSQEGQQEPLPDHWNSMAAQGRTGVPEIVLGPMKSDADWVMQIMALADSVALVKNRKRLVIPYPPGGVLAGWLPAVSLDKIIAVIAFLVKFIPPHKATVHLAAGLEYRGPPPPDVEMWQDLYASTTNGTVMTTQNLELSEYPMLYSVLRSMFLRTHP